MLWGEFCDCLENVVVMGGKVCVMGDMLVLWGEMCVRKMFLGKFLCCGQNIFGENVCVVGKVFVVWGKVVGEIFGAVGLILVHEIKIKGCLIIMIT